jgi:hypothetical protein
VEDEKLKNQAIKHLTTLKQQKIIKEYVLTSAKKITQIQDLIEILRQQCISLLSKPERFMIPKLYKITSESLQKEGVPFLIGNIYSFLLK